MFFVKLKSFLRDYFTLTSRERKGALMLAFIIVIQVCALIWIHHLSPPEAPEISVYKMEIDAFTEHANDSTPLLQTSTNKNSEVREPFEFDPNIIDDKQWMDLGLSEKQIAVIRNYLRKGGRFRDKEGFSKMYCISAEEYKRLEPYILINETKKETGSKNDIFKLQHEHKITIIELNSADTLQLQELPLVGAGRARMIYRYREKLGGFYSVSQLREVFTIDSITFQAIEPHATVNSALIRKINMNSDSLSHPYISKKTVSVLIAYRKQHGNFKDISDLQRINLPGDQIWLKVAPYMAFE